MKLCKTQCTSLLLRDKVLDPSTTRQILAVPWIEESVIRVKGLMHPRRIGVVKSLLIKDRRESLAAGEAAK